MRQAIKGIIQQEASATRWLANGDAVEESEQQV